MVGIPAPCPEAQGGSRQESAHRTGEGIPSLRKPLPPTGRRHSSTKATPGEGHPEGSHSLVRITKIRRWLNTRPLCEVCRNPSRERAHLVSQMELRQLRRRGHKIGRYFNDDKNLSALCRLCHTALDYKLGITSWYTHRFKTIHTIDFLLKHYDRHLYAFRHLLHRRNMVLVELPE